MVVDSKKRSKDGEGKQDEMVELAFDSLARRIEWIWQLGVGKCEASKRAGTS